MACADLVRSVEGAAIVGVQRHIRQCKSKGQVRIGQKSPAGTRKKECDVLRKMGRATGQRQVSPNLAVDLTFLPISGKGLAVWAGLIPTYVQLQ